MMKKWLSFVLLLLIPIISASIVLISQHVAPSDIYLPTSQWNDEVEIYKIIESTIEYGRPMGYFGYNESKAELLTFGPWSPLIIWPQVIYGKIFGWNYYSPIICNILLLSIAFGCIALVIKPTIKQSITAIVALSSFGIMSRYMLSGMSEGNCLFSVMMLGVGLVYLERKEGFSWGGWIYSNIILLVCTLMRGYYVVFVLFFINILWEKGKKIVIIPQVVLGLLYAVGFILISHYFCAPYFFSLLNFEWIGLFRENFSDGVVNFIAMTKALFSDVMNYVKNGIIEYDIIGTNWAIFILLIFYFGIKSVKEKVYIIWLAIFILIMGAMMYIYSIPIGCRHILVFIYLGLLYISIKEKKTAIPIISIMLIILFGRGLSDDSEYWSLPVKDEMMSSALDIGTAQMDGYFIIDTSNPWENSLYYPMNVDWHMLYAIPSGMSIQWVNKEDKDIMAEYNSIKSRYIITNSGWALDQFVAEKNGILIADYGGVHVWDRRGGR